MTNTINYHGFRVPQDARTWKLEPIISLAAVTHFINEDLGIEHEVFILDDKDVKAVIARTGVDIKKSVLNDKGVFLYDEEGQQVDISNVLVIILNDDLHSPENLYYSVAGVEAGILMFAGYKLTHEDIQKLINYTNEA